MLHQKLSFLKKTRKNTLNDDDEQTQKKKIYIKDLKLKVFKNINESFKQKKSASFSINQQNNYVPKFILKKKIQSNSNQQKISQQINNNVKQRFQKYHQFNKFTSQNNNVSSHIKQRSLYQHNFPVLNSSFNSNFSQKEQNNIKKQNSYKNLFNSNKSLQNKQINKTFSKINNSLYSKSKVSTQGQKQNYYNLISNNHNHTRHISQYSYLHQENNLDLDLNESYNINKNKNIINNINNNNNKNKLSRTTHSFSSNYQPIPISLSFYKKKKTDEKHYFLAQIVEQKTARFNYHQNIQLEQNKQNKQNRRLSLDEFIIGPIKGKGRYGKVYMCIHKRTGFILGIKKIPIQSFRNIKQQFINQIKLQMFISHPYIIQIYGFFIQNQYCYVLMQYMTEGDLYQHIKKKKTLSQHQTSTKLINICHSIKQLHSNNIIHRDIKPQNICLTFNLCKLCDFSWAIHTINRRNTNCGTLDYVSPEIVSGIQYDQKIDLWSLGVLIYQLLIGKPAFYNVNIKETIKKIKQAQLEVDENIFLSLQAKNIIKSLLKKNSQQRINLNQVLQHAFFTKYTKK